MSEARNIAFVCPRFAAGATVGGAETLLKQLAVRAAAHGSRVTFLTTCARNHFTWENEWPPGEQSIDGLRVIFFPVNANRDVGEFLRAQSMIDRGRPLSLDDQMVWLRNSVNSEALCRHLGKHGGSYDRIVLGPYLFGLTYFAARLHPDRSLLVPCLHDEPFAHLDVFRSMFQSVRGFMFNSVPERDLACRLFALPQKRLTVVGIGLEPFQADPNAFAARHRLAAPYVIYSGRREALKGTPLLIDYLDAFRSRTGRSLMLVLTGSGAVDIPASMHGQVLDLGFVPEPIKREAMSGAVAFCHPSTRESLSIVLLESWLAGTPALVHAGSEVLRHQCRQSNGGLWFRTYPEFEEELRLLLDQPDLNKRMGMAGKAYAQSEYSWETVEPRLWSALDA